MSRLIKILLLTLILAAVIALPSCAANITYSDEYYSLGEQADALNAWHLKSSIMNPDLIKADRWNSNGQMVADPSALASIYELRRQTILLEKQNKLIAEQNALLSNQSLVGHKITCTGGTPVVCNEWTIEGT